MSENEKMVPKRRFKEFENAEGWEQCKVGELTNVTSAARVHKEEWASSGIPFFRSSDVVSAYKGTENEKAFISYELFEQLSRVSGKLGKDDILVTGGGSIGIPYIVSNNEPLYSKDADLIWIKSSKKFNSQYLYTFFTTSCFRNYISSISHIGTIAHYTIEQVKDTPIYIPSPVEQEKVGVFFKQLDNLITLHKNKLYKMKALKKAYLTELFPAEGERKPKLRFAGFTDDWEQRKLDEVATIRTGYPFDSNDFDDKGEYLVITNGNIQNDSPTVDSSLGSRINFNNAMLSEYVLNPNDILVTMDGTVGRTAKVVEQKQILAQRVGRLTSKSDPEFLYQFLNTGEFLKKMALISHGGTIKHISLNEISSYISCMPSSSEEQTKIGTFFKSVDNLINLHQRKLEKLQNIKKAYLNEMFI